MLYHDMFTTKIPSTNKVFLEHCKVCCIMIFYGVLFRVFVYSSFVCFLWLFSCINLLLLFWFLVFFMLFICHLAFEKWKYERNCNKVINRRHCVKHLSCNVLFISPLACKKYTYGRNCHKQSNRRHCVKHLS